MAKALPLPDGTTVAIREGETPDQTWARAQQMYPEAFGGRKEEGVKRDTTGFKAAASASTSRLQGEAALTAGKIGLMDPEKAEAYYKAKEEEAKARFTPTEEGWTESPFLKFKETLGGSVPYMAAPAAAGLAALAAPVAAPTAAALGAAGAFGASAAQFTGTNLARQMDTGKSLAETSGAAAFAAAIPQAALDTAAMALMPGIGKLFGSVGERLTVEQAKAIASQTLSKTLADYAAKTGTAVGREGLTETAQQVLERVQAGLSITDPEARKEYIDSFIGGAALAGAGAPIGRSFERGAAKDQAAQADKEEKDKARQATLLQQEKARAAAEAEKQTPDYALKIAQQYGDLEQQMAALKGQVRRGTKEAPLSAEDKAFNADINQQLAGLAPQIKEAAVEKNRVTQSGLLAQAQEQQRRDAMSPEDFMLEQAGEVPTYAPSKKPLPEVSMEGIPMPTPSVAEIERQRAKAAPANYAAERVQLAQEQMLTPTGQDYVDYLMKDRDMARQIVEQKLDLPGLSSSESSLLRKTMASQFKATEKSQAQEAADRQTRVREAMAGQEPGAELLGAMREQPGVQASQEARGVEDQRLAKVLPESYALQRMAEKPAAPVREQDNLTAQVDALVESMRTRGPAPAGRTVIGVANETATKADTLRAQLSYANATDNRERANELKKQLADLNEPETEKGAGDLEFGEAAKKAGIEGRLTPDAMRANRVTRLSNSQLGAYDRLSDFVQQVRESDQDVSDQRKQTLQAAADRLKETAVGMALNEIDARRAQAGLPELALNEKVQAIGQLNQTLGELIERGTSMFQKPVEQKAQMRGTKLVLGAGEAQQQLSGRRVFNNYEAAAKALRAQMREDIDRIGGFEEKEAQAPAERKVQKGTSELRRQWQSASEREIGQQFIAAYDRAKSDEDYRTLKNIESKFKNLSETAQEEALVQVRRVENGVPLEIRGALREELADLQAAGVSETGQNELFPGESEKGVTRTTTNRFMALLGSRKIAELKAKLAEENRIAEFQAKRAATIEAKVKKAAQEAEAFQQKMLESKAKSPVQQAKETVAKLTGPESKAAQAIDMADEIVTNRNQVRARLRGMISQIEDSERKANKHYKEVKELFDYTEKQLRDLQTEAAETGTPSRMADLAMWTNARSIQETALKKAQKTLDAVRKSLAAAQDTLVKVAEDHAADTVDNALIREGEKAQRKIDKAKEDLKAAEAAERNAARVLEEARPAKEKSAKERLEDFARAAGADVIRVYRDTSDPSVQAKVTDERKNIAAAEEAHGRAKAAGDKLAMENALRRIDAAYAKVYNILNNAPVRRDTETMASHVEAYDRAQTKAVEATARLFEEEAGIKPLKMTVRKTIASVKNPKTGRIETQYKQESVAAQEARVKKEEETGVYPAAALEKLAKARADLADVQRQLDFIKDNPAAPRSEARQRQNTAREAAQAKKAALLAQIKTLGAEQQGVVKEAKLEKAAEQELRKEKQRMVRSAGRLQEAVDLGDVTYRVTNKTGTSMQAQAVERLANRIIEGWKNAPEIVVVESERNLPVRILNQVERDNVWGKLPGLYDPTSKKVYLVASNLFDGSDVIATVAHEAAGHFGLQSMLGAGYAPMMRSIYANNANIRSQAKEKMKANPNLSQDVAVEEVLADMAEGDLSPVERTIMQRLYDMLRNVFRKIFGKDAVMTDSQVRQIVANARSFVIEGGIAGEGSAQTAEATYRTGKNENALTDLADRIVAKDKTLREQLKDISTLELEMSGVDARAALEEVLKRGALAMGDDTKYQQAMYLVRKRDDLLSQVRAVMDTGALETFRDEKGYLAVRTSGKDSAVPVFEAMSEVPLKDSRQKVNVTSAYLIARRATNKGLEKLDVGGLGIAQADLDAAMAAAEADPALKAALEKVARNYNAYNSGLVKFLVQTGTLPKKLGQELLANEDYIPFYRVKDNGVAELVFSDKMVFTVGDIRNQPYLAELKGGEDKIMPLDQSIMRNTILLVDKGMTNLAERNVAYALQDIGKGNGPIDPKTGTPKNLMVIQKGDGPDDARVIRFNQEPDPTDPKDDGKRWLKVESNGTAIEGVPAELVVKSLEGSSLPLPGFLKMAGAASDLLRTGVTRTPLYIARQLYKEPMAATFTGGLNYSPFRAVLEAGKEYVRMMRGNSETQAKLIEKGLIQSQIFSGSPNDISKMALQLAKGGDQSIINKLFAGMDRAATNADAATRALVYDNARKNGMSEMQAEHMAREYMNFSKKGMNAGVQYATRLVPFLNAQIQSLNVLYKAMTGQMPYEEQLKIKRKFYNNAVLLFATGIVYAMAMEDDEYFKNARPRDKYTNFFLHLPGVDEPIKIATPFEAGYFFSLAVAAVDGMKAETNNAEQFAALRDMFLQSIPGYSSRGVPQIVKPVFEVWTDKNFFTGAPIESLRLKNMDITERYTESTTEMAKAMSKALPVLSPIQIEHIVRGYLGIAPLAAAAMINGAVPTAERGEKATGRASDLPLVGSAFQRKMGGAQADEVFALAETAFQSRTTFNTMVKEGRREEAKAYRDENKVELASAIDAGHYRQLMGRLNSDVRRTQNRTDLSGDEKRARIDRLEDAKLKAAKDFLTRYKVREDRLG